MHLLFLKTEMDDSSGALWCKNYFVHFGQKDRKNSLLKVALGVVLEVIAQYL